MRKFVAILADALTLFRGVTIPHIIVVLMVLEIRSFEVLLGLLFIGWITDFYDGTLARKANQQSFVGAHEIVFDLSFIVFILIYAFFVMRPLYWWIYLIGSIWILLSAASVYGTLRHKSLSFVAGIEVPFAPTITAILMIYGIIYGNFIDKIMVSSFVVIGAFHYKIGLRAKNRASRFISTLPRDIANAIKGLSQKDAQSK